MAIMHRNVINLFLQDKSQFRSDLLNIYDYIHSGNLNGVANVRDIIINFRNKLSKVDKTNNWISGQNDVFDLIKLMVDNDVFPKEFIVEDIPLVEKDPSKSIKYNHSIPDAIYGSVTNSVFFLYISRGSTDDANKKLMFDVTAKARFAKPKSTSTYNLISIVSHIGEYLNYGHYVAYIKLENNVWYRYNDMSSSLSIITMMDSNGLPKPIDPTETFVGFFYVSDRAGREADARRNTNGRSSRNLRFLA